MKNIIKKITLGIFALTLVFALGACGEDSKEEKKSDNPDVEKEQSKEENNKNEDSKEENKEDKDKVNLGLFKTEDLDGNEVTNAVFAEKDITMVNVFSSTCNPCVEELPYIAQLSKELDNIAFLGINIDMDAKGQPDEVSREAIKNLLSKHENNMKIIFIDENLMDIVFSMTDAIPYTFFVDNKGNMIGKAYTGSRTKEEWQEIIKEEMKNIN